ncbi:Hypothetical predicted protein [Paramuricea clavata]|uniref:Uncharacterized protein n=1 Tax=Paramuricea clavata TaxID=317549 RepID=A0A6S7ID13_PARCT|nr:Hypothetical predicted protein [Paramuricea clavata]
MVEVSAAIHMLQGGVIIAESRWTVEVTNNANRSHIGRRVKDQRKKRYIVAWSKGCIGDSQLQVETITPLNTPSKRAVNYGKNGEDGIEGAKVALAIANNQLYKRLPTLETPTYVVLLATKLVEMGFKVHMTLT